MKGIFFENETGYLHRCLFAGVDAEGHAQWVVVDQGEAPQTLREFEEELALGVLDFRLLCLEGEQAKALTVAKLIAARFAHGGKGTRLKETGRDLKRYGVTWKCDALHVDIYLDRHADGAYGVCITFADDADEYGENLEFAKLDTVLNVLLLFLEVLEDKAGIAALTTLYAKSSLTAQIPQEYRELFDEIETTD